MIKRRQLSIGIMIAMILFFGVQKEAYAVVPAWMVDASGPPPLLGPVGAGACPGWGASKDYSILPSLSLECLTSLIPSWDAIAYYFSRIAVLSIQQELINWAQGGFNGSPVFITDPQQFFTDVADQASGVFIEAIGERLADDPDFLCRNFSFSLLTSLYSGQRSYFERAHCTIGQVTDNVQDFLADFQEGGWRAYYQMNQFNNNPYGAYLLAVQERSQRTNEALTNRILQSLWSNSYLPQDFCVEKTKSGLCKRFAIKSPGKLIGDRIGKVLGESDTDAIVQADELSEVAAVMIDAALSEVMQNLSGR